MISINEFNNPSAMFRGKPFWSWNGKLDKEELIRQIHVMKEMGFGGFFMHSRTGLETEYLGDEWFELINACADEAEKLGMEAWLYDEDRWPSGIAGGMVTENPEYRMKSIKLEIVEKTDDFRWEDSIIAAFTCRLEGSAVYEYKRISIGTKPEEYKGKDILVFKVIEMSKHSFYNGYTYVDTLNREATGKFIELTHEKYREKCGDRLGRSIKGIFTDEPHRGTLMDVFGAGNDQDIYRAPWTGKLLEVFKSKFGYDVTDKLPEIFLKPQGDSVSQVKWHYVETLQQMFLDNFAKPINEWCKNNHMVLTGHVLHEDSLTAQTAMHGSVMRYYEFMEYPGVDVLTEGNRNFWIVKQLSSAARQLGKSWLLSELYGCTGWQMNFEAHKAVGDWQALFGINIRCHHLSWYTMEGEAKRDFPASILHQSAWWKEYKHVEDYFSRLGLFLSQGKPCCDVLVLNPVESVWSQVHLGWVDMLSAEAEEIKTLEEKYQMLFHWLSGSRIDFDYGDEDMISRLYSIEKHENGPVLKIGEAGYKVVIIAGMTTIRSSTVEILKEFIDAGGEIIIAGEAPTHIDAVKCKLPEILSDKAHKVGFEKEALLKEVKKHVKYLIEVKDLYGENIDDIFCQVRENEDRKYITLLNTNREKGYEKVTININTSGFIEEWDCNSGKRFASHGGYADQVQITTGFNACEEKLYVVSEGRDNNLLPKQDFVLKKIIDLFGPYKYRLDEPNICVLDMASYKLGDGEWHKELEILKVDREVRRNYRLPLRGGEMLQPWFSKKHDYEIKGRLRLGFDFYVESLPEGIVELVMERPTDFSINVNGCDIDNKAVSGWWTDKSFKTKPLSPGIFKVGLNTIELSVDFHEGINLEALYLAGNFGVRLDGNKKTLVKLPEKVMSEDLTRQGLPFYSGKICYFIPVTYITEVGERLFLAAEEIEGACIKVICDRKEDMIIAWRPYEADITGYISDKHEVAVEVVLTRRNTFGPLHQIPLKAAGYGPDSFLTEGDEFTENYMLYPSGLLAVPKLRIKKVLVR